MAYLLPEDGYDSFLTQPAANADTTIFVDTLPTQTSGVLTCFEPDGVTLKKIIYYTGIASAPNRLTGVVQNLRFVPSAGQYLFTANPSATASDLLINSRISLTASSYYTGLALSVLNGDMPMGGVMQLPTVRTIDSSRDVVDKEFVEAIATSAGGITAFMVTQNGADPSLTINVGGGVWMLNDAQVTFAGASAQAVTPSTVNYVQLKYNNTLVINTTGFLQGHIPLAVVGTNSTDITVIADGRAWLSLAQPSQLIATNYTYGATLNAGVPVRISTANGRLIAATSTTEAASRVIGITLDSGVNGDTGKRIYLPGSVIDGFAFGGSPALNDPIFLTDASGFSGTAGTFRKVLGWLGSATSLIFWPTNGPELLAGGNSAATLANFNELMTMINATDITGAELETLSSGPTSNADLLHTHNLREVLGLSGYIHRQIGEDTAMTETGGGTRTPTGPTLTYGFVASPASANGFTASVSMAADANGALTWATPIVIACAIQGAGTDISASDAFMGIGALSATGDIQENNVLTLRHVAVLVQDGTAFASVANGTTQNTVVSLGSIASGMGIVIVWLPGVSARFYVGGVLTATFTTNLPSGSTDFGAFRVGVEGDATTKVLFYSDVDIWYKP